MATLANEATWQSFIPASSQHKDTCHNKLTTRKHKLPTTAKSCNYAHNVGVVMISGRGLVCANCRSKTLSEYNKALGDNERQTAASSPTTCDFGGTKPAAEHVFTSSTLRTISNVRQIAARGRHSIVTCSKRAVATASRQNTCTSTQTRIHQQSTHSIIFAHYRHNLQSNMVLHVIGRLGAGLA